MKELHSKNKMYEKEKERLLGEVAEKEMLKIELEKLITSSAISIEKLIRVIICVSLLILQLN